MRYNLVPFVGAFCSNPEMARTGKKGQRILQRAATNIVALGLSVAVGTTALADTAFPLENFPRFNPDHVVVVWGADTSDINDQSMWNMKGSGFLIGKGHLITARHVVEEVGTGEKLVVTIGSKLTNMLPEIKAGRNCDEVSDLCIVEVPAHEGAVRNLSDFHPLRCYRPGVDLALRSMGYPFSGAADVPYSEPLGYVHTPTMPNNTTGTEIPFQPGMSGGPLIDRTGAVVGVITGAVEADGRATNFTLITPLHHVTSRLDDEGYACPLDPPKPITRVNIMLHDQAKFEGSVRNYLNGITRSLPVTWQSSWPDLGDVKVASVTTTPPSILSVQTKWEEYGQALLVSVAEATETRNDIYSLSMFGWSSVGFEDGHPDQVKQELTFFVEEDIEFINPSGDTSDLPVQRRFRIDTTFRNAYIKLSLNSALLLHAMRSGMSREILDHLHTGTSNAVADLQSVRPNIKSDGFWDDLDNFKIRLVKLAEYIDATE